MPQNSSQQSVLASTSRGVLVVSNTNSSITPPFTPGTSNSQNHKSTTAQTKRLRRNLEVDVDDDEYKENSSAKKPR